jgi:amidase
MKDSDSMDTNISGYADDALGSLDATGVAELIAVRQVSVAEVAAAATARIMRVDAQLGAIRTWAPTGGRGVADVARNAPLYGVPAVIKENTQIAGLPVTMGSTAIRAGNARRSAGPAMQFLSTGVNIVATSTMPEFGLTASTEYAGPRRPTRNPWNSAYSAGASSGGSAVLVASGAVPIAHGNDGGGSLRIPAAVNGIVGFKTTRGRMVDRPGMNRMPINIVTEGVLTRTVRDTARYLDAADRFRRNRQLPPIGLVCGPGGRRRIGLLTETVTPAGMGTESAASVRHAAELLEQQGHTVVEVTAADAGIDRQFVTDFIEYWQFLALAQVGAVLIENRRRVSLTDLDPITRRLTRNGARRLWALPLAVRRLRKVIEGYESMFVDKRVDVVLTPTTTQTTPKIGWLNPELPFEKHFARTVDFAGITPLNNISGGPAVSVPCGFDDAGLPVGVQFAGPAGTERELLELAFELEAIAPFPSLNVAQVAA